MLVVIVLPIVLIVVIVVRSAKQSNILFPCGAYDHNVLGPKGLRARGLEKSQVDVIDVLVVIIIPIVLIIVIVAISVEQSTVIRIA